MRTVRAWTSPTLWMTVCVLPHLGRHCVGERGVLTGRQKQESGVAAAPGQGPAVSPIRALYRSSAHTAGPLILFGTSDGLTKSACSTR